jgi:hypothetical protein
MRVLRSRTGFSLFSFDFFNLLKQFKPRQAEARPTKREIRKPCQTHKA